jgi:uncharacterized membrane protein
MSTNEPPVPPQPPQPPEPPAGGYGAPPPPYGSAPYGAQPADPHAWDLGAALSYGWKKFQENAGQIILGALVLFAGLVVVGIVVGIIQSILIDPGGLNLETGEPEEGSGWFAQVLVGAISSAIFLIVAQIIGAGIIRGALGITEGRPFQVGELFRTDRVGPVIVTSLIIGAATFVGTLLCYLPGLIIGFATSYSLYFVIDKNMQPVEAITASVNLVKDNLGNTIIWYIVGGLVAVAGVIACFVGVLVTIPVVLIGTAYTYKKLTGQQVAA